MYSLLYVDDEPALLEIGKLFLEKNGQFSVTAVTSAPEALEILRSGRYHAIISDYQMPGMNGIDFLRQVRASGIALPFIIFTGRGREEIVIQALNEGADFYLQKGGEPVSQFTELAHKVKKAILQRRAEASVRDYERREADLINFLPDATFAIDKRGVVIAWNRAMEKMTGVVSELILGKGNYEYAIPFYHERRPILIDLILHDDPVTEARYPYITRWENRLFSEITIPHMNNGKGAALWFTASPLYDTQGQLVGAIESIRDITVRKKAEEELRLSEQKYRTVFATTGTATVLVENDSTISLANSEFERLSGYPKEEIENKKKWTEFVVKEDLERMLAQHRLRRSDPNRSLKQYEFRFMKRSGEIRDIFLTIDLIHGTTKSVASLLDITDRKHAEITLKESEQRYRNVVEDQTEFISRFLPDGTHVFVNEAYCRYFGLKRDEILGHRFRPKIPAEDQELVRKFFESLTPGHPVDSIDHRIIMPDGRIRWQRWSDRAIFDPSGTIIEYQSVGRDKTDMKEAEEALSESEQQFRMLFSTMAQGVVYQDADGKITNANPAAERILGLSLEQMQGKTSTDPGWHAIHEDGSPYPGESHPSMLALMTGHQQKGTMGVFNPLEGFYHWIAIHAVPQFRSGEEKPYRVYTTFEDITGRKLAEEELRESEERLRTIMQSVQTGIVIIDAETHTILDANQKALAMIGATEGDVIGTVCHRFICPFEGGKCPLTDLNQTIDTSERVLLTTRGERVPVLKTVIPATISGKKALVESFIDITDMKKRDERIRLLAGLLDIVPASVTVHDLDGNFFYANAMTMAYHGYTEEEFYRINLHDLDMPQSEQLIHERIDRIKETGETSFEVGHFRKDRSVLPLLINAKMTEWEGRPVILSVATDITERKRAEESLKASETKYRDLVNLAQEGIWVVDPGGVTTFVNQKMAGMLGYLPEEMIGSHMYRFMDEKGRKIARQNFPKYEKGLQERVEFEFIKKDGTLMHATVSNTSIFDNSGRYTGTLAVISDITERKQAEEQLRESRERFQRIFEDSPLGIAIVSPDFKFLMVNRQFCGMLQYSGGELLNKSFADITHPDHIAVDVAESRKIYSGEKESYKTEKRYVKKDGSILWASLTASPVRDNVGNVLYTIALIEDITQRKQAEEELLASYREYEALLDQIQDVYYRSDLEGRLVRLSRSMVGMFGYDNIPELIGKNIAEEFYVNPADRKKFLEETNRNGKVTNYEVLLKKKDGTPVLISVSSHLWYDPAGKIAGVEGTFRDITEIRNMENAIREANKKLNLLTSITRHDVANQIAILQGYAEIALMKKPDPIVADLLTKINAAASAIARQIEFTKAYQELGMHAPGWYNIRKIVSKLKPDGVAVSCPCADEIFADPMLEKVFFNLVDNAARHGERVTTVTVSCKHDSGGLSIIVEDNGVGVPLDRKQQIFEKGYGKNTGFGLFLAREILTLTGITIDETGEPGKGARFEIRVPAGSWRKGQKP